MQSEGVVPRGMLLFAIGAATIALGYLSYQHYSFDQSLAHTGGKLQRSNAVRRRWRHNSQVVHQGHDLVDQAFQHLEKHELDREGYGTYTNKHYITEELLTSGVSPFVLLPSNFQYILECISATHNLSAELQSQLALHIQAVFLQNFLLAEFPEGFTLINEATTLAARFGPVIDTELLRGLVELRDTGVQLMDMDMAFYHHEPLQNDAQPNRPEQIALALNSATIQMDRNRGLSTRRSSTKDQADGQNILDLLYRIAEEQAKWTGYQHRGVECNGCGTQPVRGIRYHCANCWDYDLCEICEHQQIHNKTHVFYKIRIPAPIRGQIKLVQPKWYPGIPNSCPEAIPSSAKHRLLRQTEVDRQDLDALYDQFKCMAAYHWSDDPDGICLAIDRAGFDKYFTTTIEDRPPTPNLIYDRIFRFYDRSKNGFISFPDFVLGMVELAHNHTREARILRLFRAFDLDEDGYVNRRDFLSMLRAHYELSNAQTHELLQSSEDAMLTTEEIEETITSTNPISAVFGGSNFPGHRSRHGEAKHRNEYGDLVLDEDDAPLVIRTSFLKGDRADAISRQALGPRSIVYEHRLRNGHIVRDEPLMSNRSMSRISPLPNGPSLRDLNSGGQDVSGRPHLDQHMIWPPEYLVQGDVREALGTDIALEHVVDLDDRRKVVAAAQNRYLHDIESHNKAMEQVVLDDRWQRREFYHDGPDVVAADEVAQNSLDNSSNNAAIKEKWKAFDPCYVDREVGIEIIFEAVEEAFNDMLDRLFKDEEDRAMAAKASQGARRHNLEQLRAYEKSLQAGFLRREQALFSADAEATNALFDALGAAEGIDWSQATQENHELHEDRTGSGSDHQPTATEYHDPTLPQHRPNDVAVQNITQGERCRSTEADRTQLFEWHQHNLTDRKAQERGGYGRLNLLELKQKLRDATTDIDTGGDNVDDFWEAKADLGEFSFLSSWLEMASF